MAINYPSQGEGAVSAYQIAATPFVTSSTISLGQVKEINFGYVSRFLIVRNTSPSGVISVSFTENGLKPSNSNYLFLSGSESFSGDLRTDRLYISGSGGASCNFTVVGGLTTIPSRNLTAITGSNGFPGVG
jgi:hypothetical protein